MKPILTLTLLVVLLGARLAGAAGSNTLSAADKAAGWQLLFDGKSLNGWKASENQGTFSVQDGELVVFGKRSHLFYTGPVNGANFRNFELSLDIKTFPKANSGVYIHTAFQETGWPDKGYEVQVNNTQSDPVRTGSLYNVVKNFNPPAKDDTWFTLEVMVVNKAVAVKVDGKVLYEFVEPDGVTGTRKLSEGLFALQAHDPGSEVRYRNIRVKRLP